MSTPAYYPQSVRVAHWSVVLLVIFQFLTGGGMSEALRGGVELSDANAGTATVHAILGLSILAFMLWRLWIRRTSDVPPPPETESDTLQKISRGVHYAFYVILIGMPLAGAAALWSGSQTIGMLHGWAAFLLLILAIAHVAGALWHASKGDGVLRRMIGSRTG